MFMERIKINSKNIGASGINLKLSIGDDFASNLLQADVFNNEFLKQAKNDAINGIVDYEKRMFSPSFLETSDGYKTINYDELYSKEMVSITTTRNGDKTYELDEYSKKISKINFNLFLRDRDGSESWNTDDEKYWNNYIPNVNNSSELKPKVSKLTNRGDLLGYLGFDDNDIFFQKNVLKKSFIRISIYDTPYRQNQKLLFYSTLFFDSNKIYKKYTNQLYNNTVVSGSVVFNTITDNDDNLLTAHFECTNKYNANASSDGFYLYLFENTLKSGKCIPLYMKVEFNNAKFGKTIPLTIPRDADNKIIQPTESTFPQNYIINSQDTDTMYPDMTKLYNDMYIPIFIRYNYTTNEFEWYFKFNNSNQREEITLNLFEPRINGVNSDEGGGDTGDTSEVVFKIIAEEEGVQVRFDKIASNHTLEYTIDNGYNWLLLTSADTITLSNINDEVGLRGILSGDCTTSDYSHIAISNGNAKVSGKINALWDYTNLNKALKGYCGYSLFSGCTAITDISEIELTNKILSNGCYKKMFYNCSNITNLPALPAVGLADKCYANMFENCTSLGLIEGNGLLPAPLLKEECYSCMFKGCTSLKLTDTLRYRLTLPATVMTKKCYYGMFSGCTSTTVMARLSAATIMAESCFERMFEGCTSIRNMKSLTSISLANACYRNMFKGCTSITTTTITLPATTLYNYCYESMFEGCTSLTRVPTLSGTTLAIGCCKAMFKNCTLIDIPASQEYNLGGNTIADNCYEEMFMGCTYLTTSPILSAYNLGVSSCYKNMFNGCSVLNKVTCYARGNITYTNVGGWLDNVASVGTFYKNNNVPDSDWEDLIPENWDIENG